MLRSSLIANSLFSASSALFLMLAHKWLTTHIPLPAILFFVIGIGLLFFSGALWWTQQSSKSRRQLAPSIIAADWAWVVGTLLMAWLYRESLSLTGGWIILTINIAVASLASLQWLGLRIEKDKATLNQHEN